MNFFSFSFLLIVSSAWAEDYCSICYNHTLCLFPKKNIKGECGQILERELSQNLKNVIVNNHNELRSALAQGLERRGSDRISQPSASNMHKIYWNDELAKIAQRWADQCHYGHDACRNTKTEKIGQNIAFTSSSRKIGANFTRVCHKWWNEVGLFNPANIYPFRYTKGIGHYSQMAWAETRYIGCGFTQYKVNGKYKNYYVCNYGPSGNVINQTMYKVGKPCNDCIKRCDHSTKLCE